MVGALPRHRRNARRASRRNTSSCETARGKAALRFNGAHPRAGTAAGEPAGGGDAAAFALGRLDRAPLHIPQCRPLRPRTGQRAPWRPPTRQRQPRGVARRRCAGVDGQGRADGGVIPARPPRRVRLHLRHRHSPTQGAAPHRGGDARCLEGRPHHGGGGADGAAEAVAREARSDQPADTLSCRPRRRPVELSRALRRLPRLEAAVALGSAPAGSRARRGARGRGRRRARGDERVGSRAVRADPAGLRPLC